MNQDLKKSLKSAVSNVLKTAYDVNEQHIKDHLSDSQFRKVRKLANNPELFVKDVVEKRKNQARKYIPIKHNGKFNYTVVSAVYNVEKYLDEYFESLVNQSLNFKKHIHLILVDDGSTDNSANIIKKWQKKYPKNIHYYYKENGGQASARNLGLQYVQTDWVTFIDPDDFLNVDYFKNVDDVLAQDDSVRSVVCNIQMYREKTKSVTNAHPLKYRFNADVNKVSVKDLGKNINLSVAITFFKVQQIHKLNLQFSDKIKPSFEDARFIADYQLDLAGSVVFLKNSIYYYRKREDGSSTLDRAGQDYKRYTDIYQYGVIPMLKNYKARYGNIPENIQITALYDFIWQLKILLNNPEKITFLTDEQRASFYALCYELFDYIDEQQILKFGLADAWFFHKVGMLGYFKQAKPKSQICYIEEVDLVKKQILVAYYTYFDVVCDFLLDGSSIIPQYTKTTNNYLNEKLFIQECRAWLPFDDNEQVLSINIDGSLAEIKFQNKSGTKVKIADVLTTFMSPKYQADGSWLLMDRETKADDNAEHLYRYIQTHYPEQECYFALNRDSVDWDRLADDGFNLVAFGEPDFEFRLAKADKIISSHIDGHIHNYFGDLYAGTKDFVFLQHGVTKDNLSRWLNGKKYVACFVTTTKDEYHSIAMGERYKFGEKETVLTGFPRHDELYRKNQAIEQEQGKTILIMPTWRSYLMGETVGKGANTRELNMALLQSDYAKHWVSFLCSDSLRQLADEHGYQVIFAPHANIEPYLPHMNLPSYLQIWRASKTNESMQDLFVQSELLITDYSSVAFEMAYIGKPTLYYQFDKDEFFSGVHSYQKGYFEYEQHGFGAVSYDEQTLLADLADLLTNGVADEYQSRIDNTFAFQDDDNCERVYEAIKALDEPSDNQINTQILAQTLENAYTHQAWDLVVSRAKLLLELEPDNTDVQSLLVQGLINTKQWQQANDILNQYQLDKHIEGGSELVFITAFANGDWQVAVQAYHDVTPNFNLSYQQIQALEKLGEKDAVIELIGKLKQQELSEVEQTALALHLLNAQGEYEQIIALSNDVAAMSSDELAKYKVQLLLSRAHRMLGDYDEAHQQLVAFEQHTGGDISCCLEIAKLAFERKGYIKCVSQFEKLIDSGYVLNQTEYERYLQAVYLSDDYAKYTRLFDESDVAQHSNDTKITYIKSLAKQQEWQAVLDNAKLLAVDTQPELAYELTLANYRLGNIEEIYHPEMHPSRQDSYEYWQLIAEIALLMDNVELEKYCYRGMISIYPERDKQINIDSLKALR